MTSPVLFTSRFIIREALLARYSMHVVSGLWDADKYTNHLLALNQWTLRGRLL